MKSDAEIIRKLLLDFAMWAFDGEIGEGHEEEIVDKPYYGKRRIWGNAPLSANDFDALIEALQEAKAAYLADYTPSTG